ncbi:hypothetical protein Dda_7690 [Drechslerella dactyloides]|uniref:HNH nuclease domain-containing protein n=1 Tax=Drechslerella dactyloides TaxID=74499 RepID=A0AAD6ISM3_DREDA|nr:hypothetical protein Dda_7690 [Drechslerella dactyloides]
MGSLTINPAHRSELFTVKIHQGTIFNARNLGTNKCIAGFFTGPGLGISCEQIFEDLKILYPNLKIAPQGYRLALWAQEDMEISIYHEGAQGADLVLPTPKPPREWLGVMFHHPDHWRCSQAKGEGITGHVEVGTPFKTNNSIETASILKLQPKIFTFRSGSSETRREYSITSRGLSKNGIVLRADVHDIFDKRLIAIHPVTFKVRVFAPMAIVAPYHGQTVDWGPRGPPGKEALAYHYQQTVLENVGARFTLRCKISTRNKWSDSMNKILQSELPSIPTITEDIEPGGDGAADGFEDAWRPRLGRAQEEEIRSWLEKYDV